MSGVKYREIADLLEAEIAELPPGVRVGSEHETAERFGVGRATARSALQELERRMLIRRIQGVGTFTSRRIDYPISPAVTPSWSETVRRAGAEPRSIVRSCDLADVPAEIASVLGTAEGERCQLLRRQSYTDGVIAAWGEEWVPVSVVPELLLATRVTDSLDRILREVARAVPRRAWSRASAEVTDQAVARELGCGTGDPVWLVESLNIDDLSGRPLCFTRRWMRADAVRVIFETGPLTDEARGDSLA